MTSLRNKAAELLHLFKLWIIKREGFWKLRLVQKLYGDDVGYIPLLLLNKDAYVRRLLKTLVRCGLFLAVGAFIVFVTAAVGADTAGSGGFVGSLCSSIASSLGMAYPVRFGDSGLQANLGMDAVGMPAGGGDPGGGSGTDKAGNYGEDGFSWRVFVAYCVATFCMILVVPILTGTFSALFLDPINPFKFPLRAIVSTIHRCISVQVWICCPPGVMLHHVAVSITPCADDQYDDAAIYMASKSGERGAVPHIVMSKPALRGVWELRVPFDSPEAKGLLSYWEDHRGQNPGLQVIVQGTTSSGGSVYRLKRYQLGDFIAGEFDFALYHAPAARKQCFLFRKACFINFARIVDLRNWSAKEVDPMNVNPRTLEILRERGHGYCDGDEWYASYKKLMGQMKVDIENVADEPKLFVQPSADWDPTVTLRDYKELSEL